MAQAPLRRAAGTNGKIATPKAPENEDATKCSYGALINCSDFLLSTVSITVTDLTEKALAPLGLRLRHYRLLLLLYLEGPQGQGSLGASLQVDRTTVVALVDFLEHMKLAKRERCEDRRANLIALTEKGEAIALEALARARAMEAEIFSPLEPDERDALRNLMTKLIVSPGPLSRALNET